jgi:hypothetical protein
MESQELAEKLRTLQSLVEGSGFREETFDLWDEIKPHLSPEHRYCLIVAWSRSVDLERKEEFGDACNRVLSDLGADGSAD